MQRQGDIETAIQALHKSGEGVGVAEIVRLYNVPRSTLYYRLSGRKSRTVSAVN